MPAKVFISYAHADETLRDRLGKHLKPMVREGLIEPWHDRQLLPGADFGNEIDENLEGADLILFLASADSLASEYCDEIELKRALERHEAGEAVAVSIILDHCDWRNTPLVKFIVLPKDGKEVVKHPNHNEAFQQITEELRRLLESKGFGAEAPTPKQVYLQVGTSSPPSANLSVKKEFRDRDRSKFLNESFTYIRDFFEGSLKELEARHPEIDTEFRELDADRFTAKIYRERKEASSCSILRSEGGMAGRWGIMFQDGTAATRNSMSGALSVDDDGQALGFDARSFDQHSAFFGYGFNQERGLLSQRGAADVLWERLIKPLQ
jgi:hypothetical protein